MIKFDASLFVIGMLPVFAVISFLTFKDKNRTLLSKFIALFADILFILTVLIIIFANIIFNIPVDL
jgi:hypothetical protein